MAPWILTGVGNPQESHLATLRLGDAPVGDASVGDASLPAIAPQLPADCSGIPADRAAPSAGTGRAAVWTGASR